MKKQDSALDILQDMQGILITALRKSATCPRGSEIVSEKEAILTAGIAMTLSISREICVSYLMAPDFEEKMEKLWKLLRPDNEPLTLLEAAKVLQAYVRSAAERLAEAQNLGETRH